MTSPRSDRAPRGRTTTCTAVALASLAFAGCGVDTSATVVKDDRQAAAARETRARQDAATVASRRASLPARPDGTLSVTTRTSAAITARAARRVDKRGSETDFELRLSQPDTALADLCDGRTDLVQSVRKLNAAERAQCAANGLLVADPLIVGYGTAVLVTRNGTDIGGDCLTLGGVKSLLTAGSSITNWRQIGFADSPFAVAAPDAASAVMQAVGNLALGVPTGTLTNQRLRSDLVIGEDRVAIGSFVVGEDRLASVTRDTRAYRNRLIRQRSVGDAAAIDRAERAAARIVVAKIDAENRRRVAKKESVADPDALNRRNAERVDRAKRAARAKVVAVQRREIDRASATYRRNHLAAALAPGRLGIVSYPYYEAHSDALRPLEIDPRLRPTASSRPECRFPSQQTIAQNSYPLTLPIYLYGDRRTMRGPDARPLIKELLDHNAALAQQNDLAGLSPSTIASARRTYGIAAPTASETIGSSGGAGSTTTPTVPVPPTAPPSAGGVPGGDAPQQVTP